MTRLLLLAAACLGISLETGSRAVRFQAERTTILGGDSTLLTWDCAGFDSVFISGLGAVSPVGQRYAAPQRSTTYVLIAERADSLARLEVTVTVTDAKGEGPEFPELESYQLPFTYDAVSRSLPALLDRIHDALQDSQRFSVREVRVGEVMIFTTNRQLRSLVAPDDRGIAARRIAFRVDVPPRASGTPALRFQIQSLVEYRRRGEETWRRQNPEPFSSEALQLAAAIGVAP